MLGPITRKGSNSFRVHRYGVDEGYVRPKDFAWLEVSGLR
jgi:hypothetical protein